MDGDLVQVADDLRTLSTHNELDGRVHILERGDHLTSVEAAVTQSDVLQQQRLVG